MIQAKLNPYYSKILNIMEYYSLICVAITMYAGMYYTTGQHYSYMDNNNELKWFFLLVIVLPNLIFLIFWLYHMRIDLLRVVHRKNKPRLFKIAAFGQYDYDEFFEKHMQDKSTFQKRRDSSVTFRQQQDSNFEIIDNSLQKK